MTNPLLFPQIQLCLATTSTLLLMGWLYAYYLKVKFLGQGHPRALITIQEPRRMARVETQSVLELADPSGRYRTASARLVNLSLRGVCFSSPNSLMPGEIIHARLHASKEWLLHISGRVVWFKPRSSDSLYGLEIQKATQSRP